MRRRRKKRRVALGRAALVAEFEHFEAARGISRGGG
jgi:hypothetical protein